MNTTANLRAKLRTLDLNALGPRQIKTLDNFQRQAERLLDTHLMMLASGHSYDVCCMFGGGVQDPKARAAQVQVWNDTVSLNLATLGAITPKNRTQWEHSLHFTIGDMRRLLPKIQK